MFLVTAGPTVDKVIATFAELLEEGDMLIDGGNEWCAAPPPSPQALAPSPSPAFGGLRLTASVSCPGTRTPSAVPLTWPSRTRASCTWRWA